MRLSQKLRSVLREELPFHDERRVVDAAQGDWQVRCELTAAGPVGYALHRLELMDPSGQPLDAEKLHAWSERICQRVNYLLEPLRTIELDPHAARALVRSEKPRQREASLTYYELLADGKRHSSLQRYEYDRAQRRRHPVDFSLTSDQLEILVDDLVASASDVN